MEDIGCALLALLTFVLGTAVGGVLVYLHFFGRVAKLRRKLAKGSAYATHGPSGDTGRHSD